MDPLQCERYDPIFDVIDDLVDELEIPDYLKFLQINEITYELKFDFHRIARVFALVLDISGFGDKKMDVYCVFATNHQLELLKYYHKHGKIFLEMSLYAPCINGNLEILIWLHQHVFIDIKKDTVDRMIRISEKFDHTKIIQYLKNLSSE